MAASARHNFDPAKGGIGRNEKNLGVLSKQYSSRDLPSHLKLKYRQSGQGTTDELKQKDFKRELIDRERLAFQEKEAGKRGSSSSSSITAAIASASSSSSSSSRSSHAAIASSAGPSSSKRSKNELNIDADDPIRNEEDDDEEQSSESDDDEEDDTAELLAELQRIKKERAEEEARREAEKKAEEEKIRMENILSGNPLLNSNKSEFRVKRRWDDDVVFKNCARNEVDAKDKPFINDTLRSEFHKKFMEKYIK